MDQLTITDKDLIGALEEALRQSAANGESGMTRRQIQAAMSNISKERISQLLITMHDAEMLESGRVYREAIDGVSRPVPIYRLKKNAA